MVRDTCVLSIFYKDWIFYKHQIRHNVCTWQQVFKDWLFSEAVVINQDAVLLNLELAHFGRRTNLMTKVPENSKPSLTKDGWSEHLFMHLVYD